MTDLLPAATLSPLVPIESVVIHESLLRSISENGIMIALLREDQTIVDGVRRLAAAQHLGIARVPVLTSPGPPFEVRWHTNLSRQWTLVETALVYQRTGPSKQRRLLADIGIKWSPRITQVFDFVAEHRELWPPCNSGILTFSVLKDLVMGGPQAAYYAKLLVSWPISAGNRRVLADLVARCARKNALPQLLEATSPEEARQELEQQAMPRRHEARQRLHQAVERQQYPSWCKVEADPHFETPGVQLQLQVTRQSLRNRLLSASTELLRKTERLFDELQLL